MVNLTKGESVDLTKHAGGSLNTARVGLGWDVADTGAPFDLDASVITLGADGHCTGSEWFVFYNNLSSPGGAITHEGDNLTGEGDGDDEQIVIDLSNLPAEATELLVAVTIHEATKRGQTFNGVNSAYVRVVDDQTGTELARFDLSGKGADWTTVEFGKFHRRDGAWHFTALGDGNDQELAGLVEKYKIG